MNLCSYFLKIISILLCSAVLGLSGCHNSSSDNHQDHHDHHDHHEEEQEHGPHGGTLLSEGRFSLELKIFEAGVPPHYRIYAYFDDKQLPPSDYSAQIKLIRFAGRIDEFTFTPLTDFLTSDKEVEEPHSFDVQVTAEHHGVSYQWSFASYEGRTEISDQVAKKSSVKTEKALPRTIQITLRTRGKILPSEHKIAHIIPRFAGVVREGRKHIGDKVEKGEILAIIESNESLQPFEVRSQIPGTVINGHLIIGEFVPENQWVYIVADLSEVWADFYVPLRENLVVKTGQKVLISSVNQPEHFEGKVTYVAPYADEKSQSQLIRVTILNNNQKFLPGMFVLGDLILDEIQVPVAVKKDAIQTFRDWQVVFAKHGEIYEIKPLLLGKSDGVWVEVISGISQDEEYVTENAFTVKADILKSGASHDH